MTPEEVLDFWFADCRQPDADLSTHIPRWFQADPQLDRTITGRFGAAIDAAARGVLDDWSGTPRGRLALIILLDQLPRNVYRGTPQAYAYDALARRLCREGLDRGDDRALTPIERNFFYLPLLHAESLGDQERDLSSFEALLNDAPTSQKRHFGACVEAARRYRDIIARFGRFPHRNAILGRVSSGAERAFLVADKG